MIRPFVKAGLAVITSVGLFGAAHADGADAYYAPAAPDSLWSGIYFGLNAGAAWSEFDNSLSIANGPNGYFFGPAIAGVEDNGSLNGDSTDFTGGVQIGLNAQTGNWVWGVEGDVNWLDASSSNDGPFAYTTNNAPYNMDTSADIDWLMTLRGRIGYALDNMLGTAGVMAYGTAGLAVADINFRQSFSEPAFTTNPVNIDGGETKAGYAVGGGLEAALGDGTWTVKGEYLYVSFNGADFNGSTLGFGNAGTPFDSATFNDSVDLDVQVVRVGVNRKIGGYQ